MRNVSLRLATEVFRYACGDVRITLGLGLGLAARNDENGDNGNP